MMHTAVRAARHASAMPANVVAARAMAGTRCASMRAFAARGSPSQVPRCAAVCGSASATDSGYQNYVVAACSVVATAAAVTAAASCDESTSQDTPMSGRPMTAPQRHAAADAWYPSHDWDANWDLRSPAKKAPAAGKGWGSAAKGDKAGTKPVNKQTVPAGTDGAKGHIAKTMRRGTRYIVLIRHGQYVTHDPRLNSDIEEDPEEDFLWNDPLRPLTELGRKQADIAGAALAKALAAAEMTRTDTQLRVYSSDMARAKETGEILHKHLAKMVQTRAAALEDARDASSDGGSKGDKSQENGDSANRGPRPDVTKGSRAETVPLLVDSMLREGAPCAPASYSGAWKPTPHEFYEEGARIEAAFRKHMHRAGPTQHHDSVDVLVCHGNVIRYFLMRALQLPPTAWLRWSLYNGSVTRIAIRPSGSVSVRCVGDTMGQDPEEVTYH